MTMKSTLKIRIAMAVAIACSALFGGGCATTDRERQWVGVPYVLGCRVTDYPEGSVVDRVCIGIPVYWKADQ